MKVQGLCHTVATSEDLEGLEDIFRTWLVAASVDISANAPVSARVSNFSRSPREGTFFHTWPREYCSVSRIHCP